MGVTLSPAGSCLEFIFELGTTSPLTPSPSERMQAINGPCASFVRNIHSQILLTGCFNGLFDWGQDRAKNFKLLAQIVSLLTSTKDNLLVPDTIRTEQFLNSCKSGAFNALDITPSIDTLCRIAQDPVLGKPLRKALVNKKNDKSTTNPIEFVVSAYLIHLHRKKLSLVQLSDAVEKMMNDVRSQYAVKFTPLVFKHMLAFAKKVATMDLKGDGKGDAPAAEEPTFLQAASKRTRTVRRGIVAGNLTIKTETSAPASQKLAPILSPKRKRCVVTECEDDGDAADSEGHRPSKKVAAMKGVLRKRVAGKLPDSDSGDDEVSIIPVAKFKPKVPASPAAIAVAKVASVSKDASTGKTRSKGATTVKRTPARTRLANVVLGTTTKPRLSMPSKLPLFSSQTATPSVKPTARSATKAGPSLRRATSSCSSASPPTTLAPQLPFGLPWALSTSQTTVHKVAEPAANTSSICSRAPITHLQNSALLLPRAAPDSITNLPFPFTTVKSEPQFSLTVASVVRPGHTSAAATPAPVPASLPAQTAGGGPNQAPGGLAPMRAVEALVKAEVASSTAEPARPAHLFSPTPPPADPETRLQADTRGLYGLLDTGLPPEPQTAAPTTDAVMADVKPPPVVPVSATGSTTGISIPQDPTPRSSWNTGPSGGDVRQQLQQGSNTPCQKHEPAPQRPLLSTNSDARSSPTQEQPRRLTQRQPSHLPPKPSGTPIFVSFADGSRGGSWKCVDNGMVVDRRQPIVPPSLTVQQMREPGPRRHRMEEAWRDRGRGSYYRPGPYSRLRAPR